MQEMDLDPSLAYTALLDAGALEGMSPEQGAALRAELLADWYAQETVRDFYRFTRHWLAQRAGAARAAMTVMTRAAARTAAMSADQIADEIGLPVGRWPNNCHSVSLKVLRTGRFGPGRIARGWAQGVGSQHSWIVLGDNVYDRAATVVDPTILAAGPIPKIWVGPNRRMHQPHGAGTIYESGPPQAGDGTPIELSGTAALSRGARMFLEACGPLDLRGWMSLANGPMEGWPAGEIVRAILDTPRLAAIVPIDIAGMITDRNPKGLYLAPEAPGAQR